MAGKQKGSTHLRYIKDPLLNPYYIQIDDYNFTLCKECPTEGNADYETKLGHYTSVSNCLEALVKDTCRQHNYESLQDYIDQYKNLQNKLVNHFNL
jgi:hypothetical protein